MEAAAWETPCTCFPNLLMHLRVVNCRGIALGPAFNRFPTCFSQYTLADSSWFCQSLQDGRLIREDEPGSGAAPSKTVDKEQGDDRIRKKFFIGFARTTF